jgi:hypothetical protein
MTTPAPAHAQSWETTFISQTHESLQSVLEEANRAVNAYGAQGWEIVNSSVQRTQVSHHFKSYDKAETTFLSGVIVSTLKRPLPPE